MRQRAHVGNRLQAGGWETQGWGKALDRKACGLGDEGVQDAGHGQRDMKVARGWQLISYNRLMKRGVAKQERDCKAGGA